MKHVKFYTIVIMMLPLISSGQDLNRLYEEVFGGKVFVCSSPLTSFDFKKFKHCEGLRKYLDSLRYKEIMDNSTHPDSTHWSDKEAISQIIISGDEKTLEWNDIKLRFKNIDKKQEQRYKGAIVDYNKIPKERSVYKISRPIFDSKKEFALILSEYSKVGHAMTLYGLKDNKWEELFSEATYF